MKISKQEGGNSSKNMRKNKQKCSAVAATVSSSDEETIYEEEELEGNNKDRSTVVVGIKLDGQSKELLTWALVKVARPGDRVFAVHVVSDISSFNARLEESLLSILSVYDGFCNLKQIDLKLKICRGRSVRKALVQEGISYKATNLILGVTKTTFGSTSASLAKYCAKKLSCDCSVLAVTNGKILFKRETVSNSNLKGSDSYSKNPYYQPTEPSRNSYSTTPISRNRDGPIRSLSLPSNPDKNNHITNSPKKIESFNPKSNQPNTFLYPKSIQANSVLEPKPVQLSPDITPGWPFLRKKFVLERKTAALEKSRLSVVQWAMRLPNRYAAVSPTHPDYNSNSREILNNAANVGPFGILASFDNELEKELPKELAVLKEKYPFVFTLFSYRQLEEITSDFEPGRIIGNGGSSCVYRGILSDEREVAVKILKQSEENCLQEFISEIEIISELHNKNIISLVGFCFEKENLILVYEYLSRGNLEEILHGEKQKQMKDSFGWNERYKVALGIACALNYLHGHENDRPVIHRDVKSSNILLSDDFEPKLSDFGLALWASATTTNITCNDVLGTFGYLAPEYFMYGKVSEKIDVYAFGVVLLELISGRKPVCTGYPKGQESLVIWANSILQEGKMGQLVDPCLSTESCGDEIERMILAASLCIRRAPHSRPHISLIVKLLKGDKDMLKWARSQVTASGDFSSDSEEIEIRTPNNNNYNNNNIQSYINLAFLDHDDDSASVSSVENPDFITANTSLEEYLKGRWSRTSSFQ
ncbi:hypothetical protein LUZ60_007717 [Juncus effusus]|nr:hypothetical protein LUZ60_007717 [Juncus effusus]